MSKTQGKKPDKTPNAGDVYAGKRLEEFLQVWMKENNSTKAGFASEIRNKNGKKGVSPSTISLWIKGKNRISPSHLSEVCRILGRKPEDFLPQAPADKLQFDSDFVTERGRDLAAYAREEKGLHLGFLHALIDLIDFGHDYPTQVNIGYEVDPETGDIKFFHGRGQVCAEMDAQDCEMLQYRKGNDWLMMSPKDVGFLRDVQDATIKFVKYLFWVRAGQMVDEIKALNDRKLNRRDAFRNDGYTIDLSDEEDAKIDGYVAGAIREVDPYIACLTEFFLYGVNNALKREGVNDGKHQEER